MMQIVTHTSRFLLTARTLIVVLLAALILGIGLTARAADSSSGHRQHVVTIFDQGERRALITNHNTVKAALASAQIELFEGDKVEPSLETELDARDFTVNIYRARPVMIEDGMRRERIMSTHTDPQDIAKYAGVAVRPEDKLELTQPQNVAYDGVGMQLIITRATPVKLVLYGQSATIYTHAKTVGELLGQRGVKLAADDTLSVPMSAAITQHVTVEVWRNGIQTVTEEQEIPFKTRKVQDGSKDPSYKEVKTKGKTGKRRVTYEVTMKNGKEVERKEIQQAVIEEAVEQVEIVGARFNYTGGPLNEAQITALGTCESGMTASRNSGNGFYGAFQFMPSTWRKVAPAPYNGGLPHEAPLDAQKQAVQNLLSKSSIYTQFPACARKMQAQGIL